MPTVSQTFRLHWLLLPAVAAVMLVGDTPDPPSSGGGQAPPEIRFVREQIRVRVQPAGIRVEGSYFFRNEFPEPMMVPLFYPFPVDAVHPWPTRIVVFSEEGDTLAFSRPRPGGIVFLVELPGRGIGAVRVAYEQASLDHTGCYILTSTHAWQRPLERAEFEITVPTGIELEAMAYDADEVIRTERGNVYRFTREQFMPMKDLCVRWSVRIRRGRLHRCRAAVCSGKR